MLFLIMNEWKKNVLFRRKAFMNPSEKLSDQWSLVDRILIAGFPYWSTKRCREKYKNKFDYDGHLPIEDNIIHYTKESPTSSNCNWISYNRHHHFQLMIVFLDRFRFFFFIRFGCIVNSFSLSIWDDDSTDEQNYF